MSLIIDLKNIVMSNYDKEGDVFYKTIASIIKEEIGKNGSVSLDLKNMTGMSPSFSFCVFGKLYEEYEDSLFQKITFINESQYFINSIRKAIERKKKILQASGK